jgi:hypothetical protein
MIFQSENKLSKQDKVNLILLVIVWILAVAIVNPIGDFPLNDDWAYGWSVKTLLETGTFRLSDWAAANLLSQVLWGALFCLPFGFSFTALRISTLVLGLVGVLAVYGLLREVKIAPSISLLAAFITMLNPIYFGMSNSFNSDIPSFTFVVVSLYFIVRGLQRDSNVELGLGILFSFIAILNRQSSFVTLPALGLALIVKRGFTLRVAILAFVPTVLGLLLNTLYSQWLRSTGQLSVLYSFQINQLLATFSNRFTRIVSTYLGNLLIVLVYLGLFLLPFLIVNFRKWFIACSVFQKRLSIFIVLSGSALGTAYLAKRNQMPFIGNVLEQFGMGPQSLDGYYAFLSSTDQTIIGRAWRVLTILGTIGASLIISYLLFAVFRLLNKDQKSELTQPWFIALKLVTACLYFSAIGGIPQGVWFDRYLIFLLPILMMLIAVLSTNDHQKRLNFKTISIAWIIVLLFGAFTIAATHDYLASHRTRWQSLNDLMEYSKVLPEQIDGRFEFNGWYFGNRLEICNRKYQTIPKPANAVWSDFSCVWEESHVKKSPYTVSFLPKPGYVIEKQYSFRRWLPWREQILYVLRKVG